MLDAGSREQGFFIMDIKDICSAELVREPRKSLSIKVFPDGCVVVKAPLQATNVEIDAFIERKRLWVKKQLVYFNQFHTCGGREIVSGCSILYLGRQYQLIITKNIQKRIVVEKNKIVLYTPLPNNHTDIYDFLTEWQQERANTVFSERLKSVVKLFEDMPVPKLKVRKLAKRWGSYLKSNTIILNPQLIQASKPAIDVVIAHELCHYYYKDHSKAFFNLLTSKIPNWKQVEDKMEQKILGAR